MIPLISEFGAQIEFICILVVCVVIASYILKRFHQPNLVAYILIGILISPNAFDLIQEPESMKFIGELGIILLFFFIGMEINLQHFIKGWKLALFGTLGQIIMSILVMFLIGYILNWTTTRSWVLGTVIALSSSAVVFKLLEEKNLLENPIGRHVTNILLAQDIAIAPILIIISIIGGSQDTSITLPVIGGILFLSIMIYIYKVQEIKWLPFKKEIKNDHELQVFLALFFCFSGALIASWFNISEALGAFIGGLIMHAGKATKWIHDAIHSFRILFVAIFFISIGAQLKIHFIFENGLELALVLIAVYATNHFINAVILRLYNNTWSDAILGGAYLGQIGELSFLICLSAFNVGILTEYAYDFTLALISMTILISPFWILSTEKLTLSRK